MSITIRGGLGPLRSRISRNLAIGMPASLTVTDRIIREGGKGGLRVWQV